MATYDYKAMFGNLPDVYLYQQGLNEPVIQIVEPCYYLLAAGFYGERKAATYYEEGETIKTGMVPNAHMQPLNKAAGKKVVAWLEALPTSGASISIDDLTEATIYIAKNPKLGEMTPEQIATATYKIASELKARRDNSMGMILPPMAGDTIETMHQRGRALPPAMLAARFVDRSQLGPGGLAGPEVGDQRLAGARATPAMNRP